MMIINNNNKYKFSYNKIISKTKITEKNKNVQNYYLDMDVKIPKN